MLLYLIKLAVTNNQTKCSVTYDNYSALVVKIYRKQAGMNKSAVIPACLYLEFSYANFNETTITFIGCHLEYQSHQWILIEYQSNLHS